MAAMPELPGLVWDAGRGRYFAKTPANNAPPSQSRQGHAGGAGDAHGRRRRRPDGEKEKGGARRRKVVDARDDEARRRPRGLALALRSRECRGGALARDEATRAAFQCENWVRTSATLLGAEGNQLRENLKFAFAFDGRTVTTVDNDNVYAAYFSSPHWLCRGPFRLATVRLPFEARAPSPESELLPDAPAMCHVTTPESKELDVSSSEYRPAARFARFVCEDFRGVLSPDDICTDMALQVQGDRFLLAVSSMAHQPGPGSVSLFCNHLMFDNETAHVGANMRSLQHGCQVFKLRRDHGDARSVCFAKDGKLWCGGERVLLHMSGPTESAQVGSQAGCGFARFPRSRGPPSSVWSIKAPEHANHVLASLRDGSVYAASADGSVAQLVVPSRRGAAPNAAALTDDGFGIWLGDAASGIASLYDVRKACSSEKVVAAATARIASAGEGFQLAVAPGSALVATVRGDVVRTFDAKRGGSAPTWQGRMPRPAVARPDQFGHPAAPPGILPVATAARVVLVGTPGSAGVALATP